MESSLGRPDDSVSGGNLRRDEGKKAFKRRLREGKEGWMIEDWKYDFAFIPFALPNSPSSL